jgi:hypothetical protein
MIGWMGCLMLYGRSLKQTLRILLHRRYKSFFDILRASEELLHEHMPISVLHQISKPAAISERNHLTETPTLMMISGRRGTIARAP